jgi:hypothetical protein
MPTTLPRLDEHSRTVAAGVDDVWPALLSRLDRGFSPGRAGRVARLLGCADAAATGPRPLTEESTIPGFRVTAAVPGSLLELTGRHRFATYALTFRVDPDGPGRSRVRAESRAEFPGAAGGAYRLLVVGTRGHVVAVRRMLAAIAAQAERGGRRGQDDA